MTGGYGGLMAVASQAAAEAGGKVIGLPMRGWTGLTAQPVEPRAALVGHVRRSGWPT